jgi:hypothetical protein
MMIELQNTPMKDESLPGTFAPEAPAIEEILIPQTNQEQDEVATLDLLARAICDRISPRLELELQRNGYHRNTSIFSRGMMTIHQTSPVQFDSSHSKPDALELLTKEIETLLRQRLVLEQERQGRFIGRLPW